RSYTQPAPLGTARAEERRKARAEAATAATEGLNTYGWVDQGKGIARMPISNAMVLTVREWQNPPAGRSNLVPLAQQGWNVPLADFAIRERSAPSRWKSACARYLCPDPPIHKCSIPQWQPWQLRHALFAVLPLA